MTKQTGNLSTGERILSGAIGSALTLLALQSRRPLFRVAAGLAGSALLTRAAAGHCAAKSVLQGHGTLAEGVRDQWSHLTRRAHRLADGMPGSPVHAHKSEAIDKSVEESFPASDPPASHLPDEPPVNADAKWAAARAAGKVR
jgi:hypothetical protein